MARRKPVSFEASLEELESLVEQMEDGDLPLEDSLAAFEKGIRLARECQEALRQAEQRVRILLDGERGGSLAPFADPAGDADDEVAADEADDNEDDGAS